MFKTICSWAKRRLRIPAAAAAALAIALAVSAPARATNPTILQDFFLTGPGLVTLSGLAGQLKCGVQINGPQGASAFSGTPYYSVDGGTTQVVATTINSGQLGVPGYFIGANMNTGSNNTFQVYFNKVTGPQLSGTLICADSLPSTGSGGGAVSSVSGSDCVNSSGGTAPVISIPTPLPTGCGGTAQIGNLLTLASPAATPSLPPSGGQFYVDSGGALHFQSQWYDAPMPGGRFVGNATHSWFVGHTGFAFASSGTNGNQTVVTIQKTSTSTAPGPMLNLLDTLSPNITTQETSVVEQTVCPLNLSFTDLCVGLQVQALKSPGTNGTPFAGNFVSKDTSGTANGSQVAIESDVNTSEPQSSTAQRVINDNYCKEVVAQVTGETSCTSGVRSHPGLYNVPEQTGPAKLLKGFEATTFNSFPGASIGDAFSADGGDDNGLHLYSGSLVAQTNAAGTSGTNTLTFLAGLTSLLHAASPGAGITDGVEGFIPAGTTITAVSVDTTTNIATITMSNNQTGNVASGQNITITQAYSVGELLFGTFNTAAVSVTTQFGLEETLQNGMVLGTATGGAEGVGTINAQGVYVNGVALTTPSPTTPPVLFATTGQASPSPTGAPYLIVPCGTGATGCSSGTLTVTTGVNHSGNGEWIATVSDDMSVNAALTSENVSGCVVASPAPTILDGTVKGTTPCQYTLTGADFGSIAFGDAAIGTAGAAARIFGHFIISNSTTQNVLCYVASSTATAVVMYTSCSVLVQPY